MNTIFSTLLSTFRSFVKTQAPLNNKVKPNAYKRATFPLFLFGRKHYDERVSFHSLRTLAQSKMMRNNELMRQEAAHILRAKGYTVLPCEHNDHDLFAAREGAKALVRCVANGGSFAAQPFDGVKSQVLTELAEDCKVTGADAGIIFSMQRIKTRTVSEFKKLDIFVVSDYELFKLFNCSEQSHLHEAA